MRDGDKLYCHASFAGIVEELARRFDRTLFCTGTENITSDTWRKDVLLPESVELVPMPPASSAVQCFLQGRAYAKGYRKIISQADAVFVRGLFSPATPTLYQECRRHHKPVIHWIPGNPVAILQNSKRTNRLVDTLGKVFVWRWMNQLRRGSKSATAALLCNGTEIAQQFPGIPTRVTVSTTLRSDDPLFFPREDTCQKSPARILMLAFIRPEKGVEYLLNALPLMKTKRRFELHLVGSRDRYPDYQQQLDMIVKRHGMSDKVIWHGNANRQQVLDHLHSADMLVLPTLSEGTPRVLVEARASSLPIVATNVGGIPDSVEDGYDGLLVPPKEPIALAQAMDRILDDETFRKSLIAHGFAKAKTLTVDRFVDQIMDLFKSLTATRHS